MFQRLCHSLLLAGLLFLMPAIGMGNNRVPYPVPRIEGKVQADGVLAESVWQEALVLSLDYEVKPGENIPPPVRTEVLIAYSSEFLFVAFKAYDPEPEKIRARYRERDNIYADDYVGISLDTFNDERNAFWLSCNPLGAQGERIEIDGTGVTWDAIWDSGGRIHDWGYAVEMVIPFRSLRFQHTDEDQVWGIDAVRSYPRHARHHIGLFPRLRNRNCYLCQEEKIVGFAGVKPGKNIELDPTISAHRLEQRENGTKGPFAIDNEADAGLTARWGITPNMAVSGTINPDFSQIEADVLQFEHNQQYLVTYSEKRPFFLEGSEVFSTDINIIQTRTITAPDWGVKLTGKEGKNSIGYFTARDTRTNLVFPGSERSSSTAVTMANTASVLRYRRDLPNSSTIGVTFSDREADDYYNRLGSLDANLRLTDSHKLTLQGVASSTDYSEEIDTTYNQPEDEFTGYGYNAIHVWSTRDFATYLRRRERTSDLRADLGYVTQVGMRENEAGARYYFYGPRHHWLQNGEFGMGVIYDDDYNGKVLDRGMDYWLKVYGAREFTFDGWGIVGDTYYAGQYFKNNHGSFSVSTRPNAWLYLYTRYSGGDKIDFENARPGKQFYWQGSTTLDIGRHLRLTYKFEYNQLTVQNKLLSVARINFVRAIYQFTRRAYLRVVVQNREVEYNIYNYPSTSSLPDPVSIGMYGQVLFSYTINPQTVFYLGYTDNWQQDHVIDLTQTNRTIFTKLGYAWVL